MDRNCDAFIRSNNTYDILIARESLEISDDRAECIQNIGEKFVAEYFDRDEVPQLSIKTYGYSIIPKCFGLLDTLARHSHTDNGDADHAGADGKRIG